MASTYQYQPVFLIGAARSGTKLLRDQIAAHPKIDKVPYDINYIWRLGNEDLPHDELDPELLSPRIQQNIVNHISHYNQAAPFLIEKTVSNTLRVQFVHAVFPGALFIVLIRDGYDVVESVYRQWLAPPDWAYIWRKARTFPLAVAYRYAFSYAKTLVRKLLINEPGKEGIWGPKYQGINQDLAVKDLLEVCAYQWARCVRKSLEDIVKLPCRSSLIIRYEDFVRSPESTLEQIFRFIGCELYGHPNEFDSITCRNIGKGRESLTTEQLRHVSPVIEEVMKVLD